MSLIFLEGKIAQYFTSIVHTLIWPILGYHKIKRKSAPIIDQKWNLYECELDHQMYPKKLIDQNVDWAHFRFRREVDHIRFGINLNTTLQTYMYTVMDIRYHTVT